MGCPALPDGAEDYSDNDHAHKIMMYIAAASTAITLFVSVSLIVAHLRRYRAPKEQRQIIRICFAPFVFAIVSFCEILDYKIAIYIDPIGDLYEAFGLCALFLLYLQFAAPGSTFDEESFQAVRAAGEGAEVKFDWPRIQWIMVFQYPVLEVVAIIILEATQAAGDYCVDSLSPKYGHFWETVISSVSVGACVLAILRFYGQMKNRMRARRGLAKLVCFKLIVGLRFIQSIVFSILLDHNVIKPSSTFTYNDAMYGLENTLVCVEMAIIAAAFFYCYSSSEYSSTARPANERPLPIHKAILHAINPWDLIAGIGRVFTIILHLRNNGGFQEFVAAKKEQKANKLRDSRGQGRYRTVDGMESLSKPDAAYGGEDTSYYPMQQQPVGMYQPPAGSPPMYEQQTGHLMADSRRSQSPPHWDGQRYDRSPSPNAGRFTEGRDMV